MNQEIKTKWVEALRSGDYKQTKEYLKKNNCHCCLGVLCEISALETGFGVKENKLENGGDDLLGDTILMWSGLNDLRGAMVIIDGESLMLTEHNDDSGRTFLEIADAIEAQL